MPRALRVLLTALVVAALVYLWANGFMQAELARIWGWR